MCETCLTLVGRPISIAALLRRRGDSCSPRVEFRTDCLLTSALLCRFEAPHPKGIRPLQCALALARCGLRKGVGFNSKTKRVFLTFLSISFRVVVDEQMAGDQGMDASALTLNRQLGQLSTPHA